MLQSVVEAVMGGAAPEVAVPIVSNVVTALLTGGSCSGTSVGVYATYRTTWSMANPDSTGTYLSYIYVNGIYKAQQSNATVTYTVTAPGVETDDNHTVHVDVTYRIDVVRVSDTTVMNTATGNRYQDDFGDCNGPH